ncbi:vesicle transport through interaction with t-SNAREs homolog 1A isoform X1 [Tachysurus ichikawai]
MFSASSFSEDKTQLVLNVDKQLEEVRELLEQMDLEVREIPVQSRAMYNNRLKSYKQEVEKLEKDFKRSRIAYSDEVRNELLGDDGSSSESQLASAEWAPGSDRGLGSTRLGRIGPFAQLFSIRLSAYLFSK